MAKKPVRRNADFNDVTDSRLWQEEISKFLSVEDWHVVGATGEPVFENSWVNYSSLFGDAGFYKDPWGVVHIRGLVKSGTIDATIFTLPSGYRPEQRLVFSVVQSNVFGRVDVSPNGEVKQSGGTSNNYISLNLSFRV